MSDEPIGWEKAREWCRENGVPLDADGYPLSKTENIPPVPCTRCGQLAEKPVKAWMCPNRIVHICTDCNRLSYEDSEKFFREGCDSWLNPRRGN